ncbi:MAG: GTP-binding protein [Thermoplasmata archaeon]
MPVERIKKNLILLGDGAVGKTSLIKRFVLDQFDDKYITTIGTKVTKKEVFVGDESDGADMTLLVWDILGQKGYRYTQALSFGGIEGAILVADTTRAETLESLKEYWIPSILSVAGPVPMVLLGNKADLADDRMFGLAELEKLAKETGQKEMGMCCYLTSARTGDSVEDAFYKLAEIMKNITITVMDDAPQYFVDRNEVHTLVDVVDHIVADFSNQFGGLENATPIIKHQMEKVGLELENPSYKSVIEFINGLANAESGFRTPEQIRLNRSKRLYMANNISAKE